MIVQYPASLGLGIVDDVDPPVFVSVLTHIRYVTYQRRHMVSNTIPSSTGALGLHNSYGVCPSTRHTLGSPFKYNTLQKFLVGSLFSCDESNSARLVVSFASYFRFGKSQQPANDITLGA